MKIFCIQGGDDFYKQLLPELTLLFKSCPRCRRDHRNLLPALYPAPDYSCPQQTWKWGRAPSLKEERDKPQERTHRGKSATEQAAACTSCNAEGCPSVPIAS